MPNYTYQWDLETGGYLLVPSASLVQKEIRPVFHQEMDLFGLDQYWEYPKTKEPLLWAEGARRYFYCGELVAEAQGGGFFTKPNFKIHKSGLQLGPVDVQGMVDKNRALMDGFVQASLEFVDRTYREYMRKKFDQFVVAFSGGKDSLVLLDLVQRALPPGDFIVVFCDTGMELSSTYESVERAKQRWGNLKFYTARSRKEPQITWREFGPPSRLHRWCCSVHKSAPTLLLLRDLVQKESIRVLVFDGIRREESEARYGYSDIADGSKHINQVNARPIIEWNSAELFLYILERDIMLNEAYRHGMVRVGCAVCPMSSGWRDYIGNRAYRANVRPLLEHVESYAKCTGVPDEEIEEFIERSGWTTRAGGKSLPNAGLRLVEQIYGNNVSFLVRDCRIEWDRIVGLLGSYIINDIGVGEVEISGRFYPIRITHYERGLRIDLQNIDQYADRMALYYVRSIVNKIAYCEKCQVCEVECPTGALRTADGFKVDARKCTHCYNCLTSIDRGCLVAKSLAVDKGGIALTRKMQGMDRYATFGMRQEWLASFFAKQDDFWLSGELGNKQYKAMNAWLKEAGLTERNKVSSLGKKMIKVGLHHPLTWAAIWANLSYHSTIVRWYVTKVPIGTLNTKETMIGQIGEEYSHSTRRNAVDALVGLLRDTPLGRGFGFGVLEMAGKNTKYIQKSGWLEPDSLAVLYALYRYAEKMDGHYQFTMSELEEHNEETAGIDPMTLFGTHRDQIERILRGLSETHPDLIKVDFMRDLDSIYLNREKKSEDVFGLI